MVPGYTGYIPKALGCYGNRYAESCHFAISNFKSDQSKHENKREDMRTHRHVQFSTAPPTPLRPVAPKADAYLPQLTRRHTVSPLSLPEGHPGRHFISGYTGFVPKHQHYIGQGYPIITRQALEEHSGDCRRLEESLNAPVVLHRPSKWVKPTPILYKKGQGLLPRYTGHITGMHMMAQPSPPKHPVHVIAISSVRCYGSGSLKYNGANELLSLSPHLPFSLSSSPFLSLSHLPFSLSLISLSL